VERTPLVRLLAERELMSNSSRAIRLAGWTVNLPKSPLLRIALGSFITLLGLFGFLPVLGFWMIPIGLLVLSVDIAFVRRRRRVVEVSIGHWLNRSHPNLALRLGYSGIKRRICRETIGKTDF
jgi:hypothetical protein